MNRNLNVFNKCIHIYFAVQCTMGITCRKSYAFYITNENHMRRHGHTTEIEMTMIFKQPLRAETQRLTLPFENMSQKCFAYIRSQFIPQSIIIFCLLWKYKRTIWIFHNFSLSLSLSHNRPSCVTPTGYERLWMLQLEIQLLIFIWQCIIKVPSTWNLKYSRKTGEEARKKNHFCSSVENPLNFREFTLQWCLKRFRKSKSIIVVSMTM